MSAHVQFEYLVNQVETAFLCKESSTMLTARQTAANARIDGVDSSLTKAEVLIRQAERNMRNLLNQVRQS